LYPKLLKTPRVQCNLILHTWGRIQKRAPKIFTPHPFHKN